MNNYMKYLFSCIKAGNFCLRDFCFLIIWLQKSRKIAQMVSTGKRAPEVRNVGPMRLPEMFGGRVFGRYVGENR